MTIVSPPMMSQLFGRFSAPTSPVQLPGAAFLAAALLASGSWTVYWASTREPAPSPA